MLKHGVHGVKYFLLMCHMTTGQKASVSDGGHCSTDLSENENTHQDPFVFKNVNKSQLFVRELHKKYLTELGT